MKKSVEIKLLYVGYRLINEKDLVAAFVDVVDYKKEYYFKKGSFWIGSIYRGNRSADDKVTLINTRTSVGEVLDEKDLNHWSARSFAAKSMHENIRAKEKVAKNPIPEKLIKDLTEFTAGMSYYERRAIFEQLMMVTTVKLTKAKK